LINLDEIDRFQSAKQPDAIDLLRTCCFAPAIFTRLQKARQTINLPGGQTA
jgi:hypothetical protein